MKVRSLSALSLVLPYRKALVTATNRFEAATGLLVRAEAEEGLVGWGYVELFPRSGESEASVRHALEELMAPIARGHELEELGRIRLEINRRLAYNPRAKAAVESALFDLLARSRRAPAHVLLGGLVRREIGIIRLLGLDDPERSAAEAAELARRGFRALKVKLSGRPREDTERVAAVRRAVGDEVFIKADANESYDAKAAIRLAHRLADLGVEVFEQPVPRAQLDALREVKIHSPIKIEADQSVRSGEDAYRLVRDGVVDSINTSPQKVGGIFEARRVAELCEAAGLSCCLGNIAGSMLQDAVALQIAASAPGVSSLCELGEFEAIDGDPFTGLEVKNGVLRVPEGDSFGVWLRDPRFAEARG